MTAGKSFAKMVAAVRAEAAEENARADRFLDAGGPGDRALAERCRGRAQGLERAVRLALQWRRGDA